MSFAADPAAEAEALIGRGLAREAVDLLERAIAGGDAQAAYKLAQWRLSGAWIGRDFAAARNLYRIAAELGLDAAGPIYIALLASGAGGARRDWPGALSLLAARARRDRRARTQLDLLDAMAIDTDGDPSLEYSPCDLCADPLVQTFPGFLSAAECRYLAEIATPQLQPAVVVHPQTGQLVREPIRTGSSAGFPFVLEDPVIHAINRRIAAVTGTSYQQGEPLQVLAYEAGQEFRLHSDALPPGQNQRAATFLVTLDPRFEGGETIFPQLGLTWKGARGEALHFRNVDAAGSPHRLAWHAGSSVSRGRKLILSKWIRAAPLDLAGPLHRNAHV